MASAMQMRSIDIFDERQKSQEMGLFSRIRDAIPRGIVQGAAELQRPCQ
jgi:hypothetical protein